MIYYNEGTMPQTEQIEGRSLIKGGQRVDGGDVKRKENELGKSGSKALINFELTYIFWENIRI